MLFATPERQAIFWVWFYRKIQGARGCIPMDPEAARALAGLLVRVNGQAVAPPKVERYPERTQAQLRLPLGDGPTAPYEDLLRGWLIAYIDDPQRSDVHAVFGPPQNLEWFANNVPYHVAGRNIDVLTYHSTDKYFGMSVRYRYSVVELKRDRSQASDIDQLVGYSKWVASRLANGETDLVHPVLIANKFHREAIAKAEYSDWDIRLVEYEVKDGDITLHPI